MAWDTSIQFHGNMGPFLFETGSQAFATSSTTHEVATHLSTIISAFVCFKTDTTNAEAITCDGTIDTTTGLVTVTRDVEVGGSGVSAAEFYYLFIGLG